MIPYILYSALILSACLLFYKLLLQRETFFHLNRFVLIGCMVVAFTLPLIPVPQQLSFRKEHTAIAVPQSKITVEKTKTAEVKSTPVSKVFVEEASQNFNVEMVLKGLVYLYWFGVIVFLLNFLMQAVILFYKAHSASAIQDGKFRIVEITGDKAPCSFANNIFINPEKYEWETYNQILQHEKIHIEQKHTIDLLLAELVLVFQWFNPFAWQWRKTLEINLEFLTDDKMLQQNVEKESYQFSLLKVAAPHYPLSLTTNYNQSLIKKRIIMMNSKKSNVHTTWKYFFLVPVLVLFACLFNQPAAQSQTLSSNGKSVEQKQQSNIQNGMDTEGNWFATIKGNTVNIQFKSGDNNTSSTSFELSEFSSLPKDKKGEFSLTREAGTMNFVGKFEGETGMGTYKFVGNKDFNKEMAKEGIALEEKDNDQMVFFIVNLKTSYVKMLKKNGYKDIDKDQLIPLAALNANEEYITSIKQAGLKDFDLENLVPFRALGIDKAFIDDIRKSGYKDITAENLITLKSQNISAKDISDFKNSTNGGDNDEDNIVAFKSLNIDKQFIDSFKEIGYNDLSNDDLMALKSLNITPKYITEFEKSGYKNIKADDLFALKSMNITADLIKQYKDLGFTDLDLDDIIGAKAIGATPDFIKSMREKGHNFKNLQKYVELKAVVGIN